MLLHVMRHGPAEDRAPSGRDADRPLSAEGRERVRHVAEELRQRLGGALPRVLASPLLRAQQTAAIVVEVLGAEGARGADEPMAGESELEAELCEDLALDAELPLRLVADLRAVGADVLLVGHAPNVDHLVRSLLQVTGQRPPPSVASGFCTALVVTLESLGDAQRWQVRDVVDPRQLPPR